MKRRNFFKSLVGGILGLFGLSKLLPSKAAAVPTAPTGRNFLASFTVGLNSDSSSNNAPTITYCQYAPDGEWIEITRASQSSWGKENPYSAIGGNECDK